MKYGGKGNKIDHFSTFNTVQKPPEQQEGWKCLPHMQRQLLSSWSWPGFWHFTRISAHRLKPSQSRQAEYIQQKKAYSDRKNKAWADVAKMYTTRRMKAADAQENPQYDVYHANQKTTNQPARIGPSPTDKQSLRLNQVKASSRSSAPTTPPVHKLKGWEKGV